MGIGSDVSWGKKEVLQREDRVLGSLNLLLLSGSLGLVSVPRSFKNEV